MCNNSSNNSSNDLTIITIIISVVIAPAIGLIGWFIRGYREQSLKTHNEYYQKMNEYIRNNLTELTVN